MSNVTSRGGRGKLAQERSIMAYLIAATSCRVGAFSQREMVGCEHRSSPLSGSRPQGKGLGALGNQCSLELCDGAQHREREHALRRRGIDRVTQAAKKRPLAVKLLDHRQQVADRASEAV